MSRRVAAPAALTMLLGILAAGAGLAGCASPPKPTEARDLPPLSVASSNDNLPSNTASPPVMPTAACPLASAATAGGLLGLRVSQAQEQPAMTAGYFVCNHSLASGGSIPVAVATGSATMSPTAQVNQHLIN